MNNKCLINKREYDETGRVKTMRGIIGNVVFQANGMGAFIENTQHEIGFRGRWESGALPEITPEENIEYLAEQVAGAIAEVSSARGFENYVDMVHLGSGSAPIGIEDRVKEVLRIKYGLEVRKIIRDSIACNGAVFALTQEAESEHKNIRKVIATFEHMSYLLHHNDLFREIFGDGVAAIAFQSGDLSIEATNTLFDQDKIDKNNRTAVSIPHSRIGTLVPEEGRIPFAGSGSCRVKGDVGHVFTYRGGIHQPLRETPKAEMEGMSIYAYFGSKPLEIMEQTIEGYFRKDRRGVSRNLNPYGIIHQPSLFILDSIINHINESDLPIQSRLQSKTDRIHRLGFPLKGHVQHVWTPTLETTTLDHNNVSGATVIFSLLAMIEAGYITERDIMMTGMGVGHNMTSTIFRFK